MNTQTYPYFTMSPFLCPTTTLSHMRVDSEAHLSPPPPVMSSIGRVSSPCQNCIHTLTQIVSPRRFRGRQVKGMVMIEKRISKTLNIWQVIYHYP